MAKAPQKLSLVTNDDGEFHLKLGRSRLRPGDQVQIRTGRGRWLHARVELDDLNLCVQFAGKDGCTYRGRFPTRWPEEVEAA